MKCETRKLMEGNSVPDFLKFINESCQVPEQRELLEVFNALMFSITVWCMYSVCMVYI